LSDIIDKEIAALFDRLASGDYTSIDGGGLSTLTLDGRQFSRLFLVDLLIDPVPFRRGRILAQQFLEEHLEILVELLWRANRGRVMSTFRSRASTAWPVATRSAHRTPWLTWQDCALLKRDD